MFPSLLRATAGVLALLAVPTGPSFGASMKLWWDTFEDGNTTGWTINQNVASIAVDATVANTGTRSLKVTGNPTAGNGANATSRSVPVDFGHDYTVQFAFRYENFHWDRFVLFGHVRLLLDRPHLPIRYDPAGDNSFPGNSVSPNAFNSYLGANTWGWITVHCRPSERKYWVFVNGTLVGVVSYQAGLSPRSTLFFEDNYSATNYMNGWYDDFSVWGMQDAMLVSVAKPGFQVDAENTLSPAQPPDVPYHSQFMLPDIRAELQEPCSPPRANQQNGRCFVASLDMVFDRFETLPPPNLAPNPQEEIAAAANTNDRVNCQPGGKPGNWFGTYPSDARRAGHFSNATQAATALRAGCPPAGCPAGAGAKAYTWRSLGYSALDSVWTHLAPEDTVDVNALIFPATLEGLLASGYPLLVYFNPPPDYCDHLYDDAYEGLRDDNCPPEETVVGHSIVLIGYDNVGGQAGNTSGGPAFLVHDPGVGKYQWIPAQYFWDSVWPDKGFVFAAPWETQWLAPPRWSFGCKFDGTLLVTYTGPAPLDGFYPVTAQAKLTALTYVGLQGGETWTHNIPAVTDMGDWGFTTWKLAFSAQPPCNCFPPPCVCLWTGVVSYEAWGTLNPATASVSYASYADKIGNAGRETKFVGGRCGKLIDPGHRTWPYPGRWWDRSPGGSDLRLFALGGPDVGLVAAISNQGEDPIPVGTVARFYFRDPTVSERAPGDGYIGELSIPPMAPEDTMTIGPLPWTRPPLNGFGEPYFAVFSEILCTGDPPSSVWPQDENNYATLASFDVTAQAGAPESLTFVMENPEPGPMDVVLEIEKDPGAETWQAVLRDTLGAIVPEGGRIPMAGGSATAVRAIVTPDALGDTLASIHVVGYLHQSGGDLVRPMGGITLNVRVTGLTAVEGDPGPPAQVALDQNVPNPFVGATTIGYAIPRAAHVSLRIYDVAGRLVRTLVSRFQPAGRHSVRWDGHDGRGHPVAHGIYFYRLDVEGRTRVTRRLIVFR